MKINEDEINNLNFLNPSLNNLNNLNNNNKDNNKDNNNNENEKKNISPIKNNKKSSSIPLLVESVNKTMSNNNFIRVYCTLYEDSIKIFTSNPLEINNNNNNGGGNNNSVKPIHDFPIKRVKIIPLMSPKAFTIQDQQIPGNSIDIVCHTLSNANKIINFVQVLMTPSTDGCTLNDLISSQRTTQNVVPSKLAQRLSVKQASLEASRKENRMQNQQLGKTTPGQTQTQQQQSQQTPPPPFITNFNQKYSKNQSEKLEKKNLNTEQQENENIRSTSTTRRGISTLISSFSKRTSASSTLSIDNIIDDQQNSNNQKKKNDKNVKSNNYNYNYEYEYDKHDDDDDDDGNNSNINDKSSSSSSDSSNNSDNDNDNDNDSNSITSESSSSDEDIVIESALKGSTSSIISNYNNSQFGIYHEQMSASGSVMSYFNSQQMSSSFNNNSNNNNNNNNATLLPISQEINQSVSQSNLPSYLRSTRSSSRKEHNNITEVIIEKNESNTLRPKYTPFGPIEKNNQPKKTHQSPQKHTLSIEHRSLSSTAANTQTQQQSQQNKNKTQTTRGNLIENENPRFRRQLSATNNEISPKNKAPIPHTNNINSSNTTGGVGGGTRSNVSSYSKKNNTSFFEKFSGRIKTPGRNGWGELRSSDGTQISEPLNSTSRGRQLNNNNNNNNNNLQQKEIYHNQSYSHSQTQSDLYTSRGRSRSKDKNPSPKLNFSPTRFNMMGQSLANVRQNYDYSTIQLNNSNNNISNTNNLSRHSTTKSKSPFRNVSSSSPPSRFKTPDELRIKRPTADTQRRNILTDAAEYSRMSDWLVSINMEKYIDHFKNGGITKLSVVELLQYHDLVQLNIDQIDIPFIISCIEDMTQRTTSFTDEAPLTFLPKQRPIESKIITSPEGFIQTYKEDNSYLNESNQISSQNSFSQHQHHQHHHLDNNNNNNNQHQHQHQHQHRKQQSRSNSFNEVDTIYHLISFSSDNKFPPLIDGRLFMKYFENNSRHQCLKNWSLIKHYLQTNINNSDIHVERNIFDQIHTIEFYMRLYFAVNSITNSTSSNSQLITQLSHSQPSSPTTLPTPIPLISSNSTPIVTTSTTSSSLSLNVDNNLSQDYAMQELKSYLESLMTSSERSVSLLVNSRLYAAYGAIVLVPDPRSNPAYSSLFEQQWGLNVKKRIRQFLNGLVSIRLSSTEYEKYSKNFLVRNKNIKINNSQNNNSNNNNNNNININNNNKLSGNDNYYIKSSILSSNSPTNIETELDMMKVLNTMEASEKLHKVLRESNQSNVDTVNATKQYRASVPKEHTPSSLQNSLQQSQSHHHHNLHNNNNNNSIPSLSENQKFTPIQQNESNSSKNNSKSNLSKNLTSISTDNIQIKNPIPKVNQPKSKRRMSAVLGTGIITIENDDNNNNDNDEDDINNHNGSDNDSDNNEDIHLLLPKVVLSDSDSSSGSDNEFENNSDNENKEDKEYIKVETKIPKLGSYEKNVNLSTNLGEINNNSNEEKKEGKINHDKDNEEEEEEYDFSKEKNFVRTVSDDVNDVDDEINNNNNSENENDNDDDDDDENDDDESSKTKIKENENEDEDEIDSSINIYDTLTANINQDSQIEKINMNEVNNVDNQNNLEYNSQHIEKNEKNEKDIKNQFQSIELNHIEGNLQQLESQNNSISPNPYESVQLQEIRPKDDYIQYLKGNFKGLEKTKSQKLLDNLNQSNNNNNNQDKDNVINDSNNSSFQENDEDNVSDEENTEFTIPLQLGNLNNRGQFIVMTKEEEEAEASETSEGFTRQSSLNLDSESFDLDLTSPTVATALFRMVSMPDGDSNIISGNGNGNSHSNSNIDNYRDNGEMTLETKKSNLSILMEKMKNTTPKEDDNSNMNGWELIGARWIKKNAVSEDELKAVAAVYSSNRRHKTGTKKVKRHSSAELSSYLPLTEEPRSRTRSKSIAGSEFWAEPSISHSYSDDKLNDHSSSLSPSPSSPSLLLQSKSSTPISFQQNTISTNNINNNNTNDDNNNINNDNNINKSNKNNNNTNQYDLL